MILNDFFITYKFKFLLSFILLKQKYIEAQTIENIFNEWLKQSGEMADSVPKRILHL